MGLAVKVWTGLVAGVLVVGFGSPTIGSGQRASLSLVGWNGVAVAQTVEAQQAEATRLFQQGVQQFQTSQFNAALQSWEQALALFRALGNRQGEAASLGSLGIAYDALGQHKRAITFHEHYRDMTREIGDRQGEAASLGNLGLTYDALGQYQQALECHQQSLNLAQEVGDRKGEASSLDNLGGSYYSLGQYQQAIELHHKSIAIRQEIEDRLGQAFSLGNLGNIYASLGQYEKAIDFYTKSYDIMRDIGDRKGIAIALNNIGSTYRLSGQYLKAIDFHQQSLKIKQAIGDYSGEATSLNNLGNAYSTLGQYQQAIQFYKQALVIEQEVGDRLGEAASLGGLGSAHNSLGQYEQAIDFHQRYFTIAREIGNPINEAIALNSLGNSLQNLAHYSEAEQQLLSAVEVYESIRADLGNNDTNKVSIFEQQSSVYSLLQQTQIAQNKTTAALETAERGRARAFVELLHRRLNPNDPNPQVTPPNLSQIKQIARQQNATLVEYSVTVDSFDLDNNPGKEATKESALYIWVIPPNGDISFRQVDLTPLWRDDDLSLWELVQFTRDSLGVRGLNLRNLNRLVAVRPRDPQKQKLTDDDQLLRKLHSLLIEPIADLLPQDPTERVIFIPQGSLFLVPFPALKNATGDYLIQNHTILTAPSIQTLSLTRTQKQQSPLGDGALIVGNPTMPSIAPDFGETPQPLTQLPGAEQEAKAIADLLNTNAVTGNAAQKSAMVAQMQDAELIHLATHGLLDDIRGIGSAIALAPDPNFQPEPGQVNGLLTAEEIFDLNLKADLVVLSACDTGRGRITGDGVVGLSRSFIAAGVPSVLVSLWQVPDAPTAQLMTEFYRQREQAGDNAQALRQAMLQTLARHPEPRNWAAFTLIGEAD
ncbi:MAG: CHAT domain-containing protein [Spirulina sp. SIO3F2]|nr:CHAT domain-containing protein [Spirulina sp. SIO3F2]